MEKQGQPTSVSQAGDQDAPAMFLRAEGEDTTPDSIISLTSQAQTPTPEEFLAINEGLSGWENLPGIIGARYYPSPEVESTLFANLQGRQTLTYEFIETIAQAKTGTYNTHALLHGRPFQSVERLRDEAKIFLLDLKVETAVIDQFLRERFGFTGQEFRLVHQFIAKTAPILYNMGFPDAIAHSSQVARLCALQAERHGASQTEIMQALLVGWLHDPKLESHLSWSNLAAHPVIASAIAHQVLNSPDMRESLEDWLSTLLNPPNAVTFALGVENALAINNDSRYVLENVILNVPDTHPVNMMEPGVGLLRYLKPRERDELDRVAHQRFESTALQDDPEPLSQNLQTALAQLTFETGLRGIRMEAFYPLFNLSAPEDAEALFRRIIRGEYTEPQKVAALSARLQREPALTYALPISALRLFSHHDEIVVGRIPALALAISDPLLLSPHKLLESGNQATALERLQSFLISFQENIRHLPRQARQSGSLWQRDLLLSIAQTAETLTQKPMTESLNEDYPLDEQSDWLIKVIRQPETWISADGQVNYGVLSPDTQRFEMLLRVLREKYEAALQQSPALFGE